MAVSHVGFHAPTRTSAAQERLRPAAWTQAEAVLRRDRFIWLIACNAIGSDGVSEAERAEANVTRERYLAIGVQLDPSCVRLRDFEHTGLRPAVQAEPPVPTC